MSTEIKALEQLPSEADADLGLRPSCHFVWTGTTSATLCHPDRNTT